MCGIAGICNLDNQKLPDSTQNWVSNMITMLTHRGPDDGGVWLDNNICLGHRRLSIIDLVDGKQPMHSNDNKLHIVFNGEIYNFKEIKDFLEQKGNKFFTNSDTEVLLESYRYWGEQCLEHLNGMFAFTLWDSEKNHLFCGRDRFGKKPFFYTFQNNLFCFASELNVLLNIPSLNFTLNPHTILQYLAYEYVPTPNTMYSEIFTLQPAHFLIAKNNSISIKRYWDLPVPDENIDLNEIEISEQIYSLLSSAVKKRMISDVPIGVFLSGGIDSSIVTGLMANHSSSPIKTFSIGFEEASYDESNYAKIVANTFNTHHHEQILSADTCADILPSIITKMDVPMADASVAPTWLLSKMTKEHVTVALGGDGSDELWAGYEHYIAFKTASWYNRFPKFLRKYILEPIAVNLPTSAGYINLRLAAKTFLQGAKSPDWLRIQTLLTSINPDMQHELLNSTWQEKYSSFLNTENIFSSTKKHFEHWQPNTLASPLARAFHVYINQFLLDDILVKIDRASMLNSLEVRAPFLDKDFAEFTAKLPIKYKLNGFKRKYLLKKAFSKLLPHQILYRNKRGFQIPVADWLRGKMKPLMQDMLSSNFIQNQGIFNHIAIQKLIDTHISLKADLRKPLWTLLVFQLWWQAQKNKILSK